MARCLIQRIIGPLVDPRELSQPIVQRPGDPGMDQIAGNAVGIGLSVAHRVIEDPMVLDVAQASVLEHRFKIVPNCVVVGHVIVFGAEVDPPHDVSGVSALVVAGAEQMGLDRFVAQW